MILYYDVLWVSIMTSSGKVLMEHFRGDHCSGSMQEMSSFICTSGKAMFLVAKSRTSCNQPEIKPLHSVKRKTLSAKRWRRPSGWNFQCGRQWIEEILPGNLWQICQNLIFGHVYFGKSMGHFCWQFFGTFFAMLSINIFCLSGRAFPGSTCFC